MKLRELYENLRERNYQVYNIAGIGYLQIPVEGRMEYIEISNSKVILYTLGHDIWIKSKSYISFEDLIEILDEFDAAKIPIISPEYFF